MSKPGSRQTTQIGGSPFSGGELLVLQHYEIRLFDEFVLRGNMAVIRCPIPSFVSDYVKVTSWERIDGFLITPGIISAKYGMLESGDLYIRDTTEHDGSYSFRCHTENTVTKEKKVSMNYSRVIVTEPHHNQPPRITRRLNRVLVQMGHRATLPCIAQGYPVPAYRWHRAQADQRPLPDHTISVSQEGGVLIFHKVVPSDTGRYVCHVTNVMGEDKVDTELIVEEPHRVAITPAELRLEVGKTATLNCSVVENPAGSVTWKKDMLTILPSPRVIFPNPYLLQVRQIRRQDAGMYQCFVHRELNSAQAAARIIIGDLSPTMKLTFPEKTVRPGRYVSLTCIASGHPEPLIRWTLDGIWPLSTRHGVLISSYQTSNGDVVSSVNFTSVSVSDSGVYSCEASNDAGSVSYSKRLNVFGPLFIRTVNNLTALAGEAFMTLCPFGGYPFDAIRWKRDERILPVNQRQRVFPNGTLLIAGMQPGVDDGIYSCEVSPGQDMTTVSRSFRIIIRTKPKVSKFSFQDNLHEGMRTAVTCIVVAGDGPLTTRWLKDDLPLDEKALDATVIPAEEGFVSTITIKSLAHKHNGNYSCLATNDVGTGSFSAILTVKVPPRWILEPSDTYAVAGRSAIIDCQADGVPQPHVRWKVATDHPPDRFKTIVSSSHVHILVNGSLNFRSVETSDAGFYLCEAKKWGLEPNYFTTTLCPRNARDSCQRANSLEKLFKASSALAVHQIPGLKAAVRYSQNVEEMDELGIKASLIIEKAERKDSALFMCTAANDFGEDTMNIQVTIKDIPDAPQNLEVHDVSSRSIRLTWDRPFDGNSPITQYTVMWRQTDEPKERHFQKDQTTGGPITTHGNERSVTVRGLKPKTRYFFRVKCLNALGESQYGAEVAVTTLEEPPRLAPRNLRAIATSSKSVNVSWELSLDEDDASNIDGFYVGYKITTSPEPYTFIPVDKSHNSEMQSFELVNLKRFTEYSFIIQAYNKRGAGPPSEAAITKTLEFDRPAPPTIKSYYSTSTSIKISWEYNSYPNAPVTGFILHHRMDGTPWQETHVTGERTVYTLHDLLCGTKYYCFIVATNSAGRGNSSEIISTKTAGSSPLAPDKRLLLSVNSTTVTVNLNSWHNGGCPVRFFVIQYKISGHQEWTLVSNNVIPEQQTVTITDLVPGTWYSLLMTARNDAGSTDAEYIFATLTLSGEYPPRPSEVSDVTSPFYRHLTITVPVVSSAIVLILVICVVCVITKRRTPGCRPRTPDGADGSDTVKQENIPLSATYDSGQDPTYYPAPYATSRVQSYNREHCVHPSLGNQQNTGTFGSTRSGYTYNIPCPPRRNEKEECIYQTPAIYFSTYHHTELRTQREHAIYEVPDRGRMILEGGKFWREAGDGNSSTESDNEDMLFSLRSTDEIILREEARESETECDRLWKTYEVTQCQEVSRWAEEVLVS
ncbi:Down syndrome cell adhesion molecule like protein [Argiope bruennichi]|uniref:Down syndrome cell adhesion molecule like protein n=1 Tax=Argiope bruennichi TaxID=94029 RepID=A0A8T0G033_ARGBR|nr:Down syndrome cell adhesion molecule like protein [Argiope bruennichi]